MDPSALGRYLRESREAKELTLEQAVQALRIRRDILESFEQGEFNVLDSTVRVRGMLRNYAHYLGLDEERVLQYHEAAITSNPKRRRRLSRRDTQELVAPRTITDTPPAMPAVRVASEPSSFSVGAILRNLTMLLVSVAALAVIVFVIAERFDWFAPQTTEETPAMLSEATQPIVGDGTLPPTLTPSLTPRTDIATDTPDVALSISGIQVALQMRQRSWVRVTVDDVTQYTGILDPEESFTYTANDVVEIVAANAAALDINFNGVQQQPFGARGQQVTVRFTPVGVEISQPEGQTIQSETAPVESTTAEVEPTQTPEIVPPVEDSNQNASDDVNAQTNADTAEVADANLLNTPIPTSSLPSPTPLFPMSNVGDNAEPVATNEVSEPPSTPNALSTTSAEQPVAPVATDEPTITPSPAAVLPLRQPPTNPTPTKNS
ncbi:MAG: RodZ domain-containing protein [Anaerolineae bacterium]